MMPGMMGNAGNMPGMQPGQQPNMDQMLEMLNNPMIANMMEQMVQNNPDMLRNMIEQTNPMMAQMFQNNPQMANDFIRQTMNPTNLRNMINMQRSMMGGNATDGFPGMSSGGGGGGLDFSNLLNPQSSGSTSSGMPAAPPMDFMNFLNQFQNTGLGNSATPSSQPQQQQLPADRFRSQLQSLADMGFDNEQANLIALQRHHGNLNRAVDDLIMGNVTVPPAPAQPSQATATAVTSTSEQQTEESTQQESPNSDAGEEKDD